MSKRKAEPRAADAAGEGRASVGTQQNQRPESPVAHNVYCENRHNTTRPPWAPSHLSDETVSQVSDLLAAEQRLADYRMHGLRSADSREFVAGVNRFEAMLRSQFDAGFEAGRGGAWVAIACGACGASLTFIIGIATVAVLS